MSNPTTDHAQQYLQLAADYKATVDKLTADFIAQLVAFEKTGRHQLEAAVIEQDSADADAALAEL